MPTQAPSVRVRRGVPEDAQMLAELGATTFRDAFGADNRPEDLARHLETTYDPAIQERELADTGAAYFIAEVEGSPAGYAFVREKAAPAAVAEERAVELARFYVDRRWHGSGVAGALMAASQDEARRRGARVLWLGVWERNPRAIRFYEKCGFRDVGGHTFYVGSDAQRDRLMVCDLTEGRSPEAPR